MNLSLEYKSIPNIGKAINSSLREQEIFRVVLTIDTKDEIAAIHSARSEVLRWAQNRSGGELPKSAWQGESFETFFGGRTTIAVAIEIARTTLWSLRADDPDKTVPGRIWTTEVSIGWDGQSAPQLSVRQIVSTPEVKLNIQPHVPGFLHQIARAWGLLSNSSPIEPKPFVVSNEAETDRVIEVIEDNRRRIPVILVSGDERDSARSGPLIDIDRLAKAVFGLAHVAFIPSQFTYSLSDNFGRRRSVFHGGIRIYLPGFDSSSDPHEHTLFLSEQIQENADLVTNNIRNQVSQESLRRTRIGHDVLSFASVRSAALRLEQEARVASGASDTDQLEAARLRIDALEAEVAAAKAEASQSFQTAVDEEERAKLAEAQWHSARLRIESLEHALQARGIQTEEDTTLPLTWAEFAEWADKNFIGRLVLGPAARRGVRSPLFTDVATAARSLLWLATVCRDRFSSGGGTISNIQIENGVENAPCGSDTFTFELSGRKLTAN